MEDTKEYIDSKKHDSLGEDDAIVESDIELDNTDIVEPDNDPPQKVNGWKYWLWIIVVLEPGIISFLSF